MKIRKNGNVVNLTESDLRRIVKQALSESEEAEFDKMIDDEKTNSHISVNSRGKAKKICEECIKPLVDSGKLDLIDAPNCNFCKGGKINESQAWRCANELKDLLSGQNKWRFSVCVLKNARKKWSKIGE